VNQSVALAVVCVLLCCRRHGCAAFAAVKVELQLQDQLWLLGVIADTHRNRGASYATADAAIAVAG
jgi:hypothetical protein